MYYAMRASAPSLHRESTDSLISRELSSKTQIPAVMSLDRLFTIHLSTSHTTLSSPSSSHVSPRRRSLEKHTLSKGIYSTIHHVCVT